MRVAIYARVSTDDGRQTTENQVRELHLYAERMGWTITKTFLDQASGKRANRPGFLRALESARRREFDLLLFWSLDRLSREGALKTLATLNLLTQYGVKYRSLQEQYIDSVGGFGDAIVGVIATLGKLELERASLRIKAGLNTARANGQRLGRPRQVVDQNRLVDLRNQGLSLRQIGKATGISAMTVKRLLAAKPDGAGGAAAESIPEQLRPAPVRLSISIGACREVKAAGFNRRMRKTACPVVWEGGGAQSPSPDPLQDAIPPDITPVISL